MKGYQANFSNLRIPIYESQFLQSMDPEKFLAIKNNISSNNHQNCKYVSQVSTCEVCPTVYHQKIVVVRYYNFTYLGALGIHIFFFYSRSTRLLLARDKKIYTFDISRFFFIIKNFLKTDRQFTSLQELSVSKSTQNLYMITAL